MTVYDISIPDPEEKEGKRGYTTPPYLSFQGIPYQMFRWTEQNVWRDIVELQPIASLCRETITERISTIDWRIEPVDTTKRQELRTEIQYYTRLFEQNNGFDVLLVNEWVLGDALDLPFGSGVELVYQQDDPSRRLVDYILLDGATLFPTNNADFPVVQMVPGAPILDAVAFPKHAINRMYYAPRRNIKMRGWGMAPPEKIYMALQMLVQGDRYYWKLLIDTPEAGILDLLDMEREAAEQWLASMRVLLEGQDALKVPVLYEHTKEAKFIPFGRPPSEIMYDSTLKKYAEITCAGYGLSLSDLGISASTNGGETLAGSIRQERSANRKGIGFAKEKMRLFRNRMMPNNLQWVWIDPDEEQQVARGRAKLSSSAAYSSLIDKRVISPKEARQDYIGSGLSSVALPEDIPEEDMKLFDMATQGSQKRENMLTATQPPSAGGQGEVRASMADRIIQQGLREFVSKTLTPETLDLDEEEYLEMIPMLRTHFNEAEVTSLVLDLLGVQYEQARSEKSFFSLGRWKSFDSVSEQVEQVITSSLKDFPNKVAERMIQAKSYALDNSEEVSDNFTVFQSSVADDLVQVLAADLGEKLKGII